MTFTVQDYHDLARLLAERPEWRSELRSLVLSDELLSMPEIMRELAAAQQRTEERLLHLESAVQSLAEQMQALVEQVRALTKAQRGTTDIVGGLKGRLLELTYRDKAGAYFGPLVRRLRVVEPHTLEDALEATLAPGEFRDVLRLDLLVSGQPRHFPEAPEVWLAVEISAVVDQTDVDRAWRRASLLRRAGYRAVPTVAGEQATPGAEAAAHDQNVVLLQDGQVKFWEEALSAWVSS